MHFYLKLHANFFLYKLHIGISWLNIYIRNNRFGLRLFLQRTNVTNGWILSFWLSLSWMTGFPGGSVVKESTCQHRRCRFNPWARKIPGEGNGNLFKYSCMGNPMDRGAWQTIADGVTKSWTWLSNWTETAASRMAYFHWVLLNLLFWAKTNGQYGLNGFPVLMLYTDLLGRSPIALLGE